MDILKQTKKVNQQLQPTGRAWNYIHGSEQVETEVVNFVDGLNNPFVDGVGNHFIAEHSVEASSGKRLVNAFLKSFERLFTDIFSLTNQVLADNDGFDEVDAENWERLFGLNANGQTLEVRKGNILRKQSYPQGVAERGNYLFIQEQLQAAGFDVYITENRFADGLGGWDVVNPDSLATEPVQYGTAEYGIAEYGADIQGIDYTICANRIEELIDSEYFEVSESQSEYGTAEYGVAEYENANTTPTEAQLRSTFFIGGSSFPSTITVPLSRKDEFRELILKLKPCQTVAFLYINYI